MKQHILIAILALFTAFSLSAQVINNPSGNTSNNLYSTSICYVNAAPTWNPDVSAASKWCKIAYNESTGEVWYWQTNKVATGNGAWVSASVVTRMASNSAPSHTPPNPAEIVILPNGTLYTWNGSAWATVGGSGSTNLTTTTAPTTVTVNSDTGTDAIIPAATTSNAGVMTATDKTNLNSVVTNSHVPVTVTDGSKIDFTLTGQDLTATIIPASIANTDLAASGASSGQVLKFNGTNWVPAADNVGSVGSTNLTGGTQIAITNGTGAVLGSSPVTLALAQNGATIDQAMIWNGAAWGPGSIDATAIPYSPTSPLTSTDVQGALDELALNSHVPVTAGTTSDIQISVATGQIVSATLKQQGATTGQVLKWNGSAWAPGTDNSGGGGAAADSSFSRLSGSFIGKTPLTPIRRSGPITIAGADTTAFLNIGRRSAFNPTDRPLLIFNQDTTRTFNRFFQIPEQKRNPYGGVGFGFLGDIVGPQPDGYYDMVYSFGPNCDGNSGVAINPAKTMAAINWEMAWNEGGIPTDEWHEHWKQPDSSAIRLTSWTIRYPNGFNPSAVKNLDKYFTADQFRVQSSGNWNNHPVYFTVQRNPIFTNGSAKLSLATSKTTNFSVDGALVSGVHTINLFPEGTGATSNVLNLNNFNITTFGNGDTYTRSTRTLDIDKVIAQTSLIVNGTFQFDQNIRTVGNSRFISQGPNYDNVFVGRLSGPGTISGASSGNIGIGYNCGSSYNSAYGNISIGRESFRGISTGIGNIGIGYYAGAQGNFSKSVVIGDSAMFNASLSNRLWVQNGISTTPLISGVFSVSGAGKVGINVANAAPTVTLDVNGTDAIKIPSGTTAQRPTAANGQIRNNATTGQIEGVRNGSTFESFVMGSVPATLTISGGAGSPEGVVTAAVGSMYLRTDGGAGTTLYIKESGTGNTGWIAK